MKNKIKIGDKVIYHQGTRSMRCKVLDFKMSPYFPGMMAEVEFEDTDLFPRIMNVDIDHLVLIETFYVSNMDNCICGLKFTREGGRHSSWCDVKNDD